MKWLIFVVFLCAFTPVANKHDTQDKTDSEFVNIYQQAQSKNFKVVSATPSLNDLQDGEIVIVSSITNNPGQSYTKLMFRSGQEIFSVNLSCVTVRR